MIISNYVKVKIDYAQENSKCSLCGVRDKTTNHISECSKQVQRED